MGDQTPSSSRGELHEHYLTNSGIPDVVDAETRPLDLHPHSHFHSHLHTHDHSPQGALKAEAEADTASAQLDEEISQNLEAVTGVLQDMAEAGQMQEDAAALVPTILTAPMSPGIPPVAFGAGGADVSSLLRLFDESAFTSQRGSAAGTPPMSVKGIGNKVAKPDYSESKIVVAMVGLPARGKSYLSNKLMIYLKALKVFNVGQLRRTRAKAKAQRGIKEEHNSNWFSHANEQGNYSREELAHDSLEMLIQWLKEGGNVGIHDATNSTRMRRGSIEARVSQEPGFHLIFLESCCDDPAIIATNVALKVSSGDPDYKDMPPEEAKRDFLRRISEYEKVYETITEPHLSYVKIVNVGAQVTVSRIHGYLQSRIAFYLMNLHLKPRSIYLSRHGESQFNVQGKIGGDSLLSPRGMQYAAALPALIIENVGDAPLTVWTSTLRRTIQTAEQLPYPKLTWKSLDELDAGVCDGMTYEQAYPDDYANRDDDKFNYRYRGGESYRDVVVRLEPVIMELERQENILIIGHQAILRCLYAYFHHLPQADLPYLKIPLHTVIKLTPKAYGCDEERYALPIEAVDTHRPKPKGPAVKVKHTTARQYFTPEGEV
ncbi:bifunctional 6-phosphofructo-2-kinase/fructose-2,6-bisphosphate 2-phosphatase [Ephemerocybe angulata]|uniref:fructose-2,6-bisphosphate 2-phosphatase n=1 Tax=Ephemerocybe angulata TaxID=980116 RepID=A0A8H6HYA1_9AGAR|nr:bifunctional 6-phosphofructo-2-kinase/fructose-2,6-bisphosphate 2-phosphatase [Tulosesus angulatus]